MLAFVACGQPFRGLESPMLGCPRNRVNINRRIYIEAKGATSARESSERFGKPFDSAQVRVHVAEAVYKCLQVLSRGPTDHEVTAGLALPANQVHKSQLASVEPMLASLDVAVFWVSIEAEVRIMNWDPSA
ncbi:MAG: hypothetical protein ACYC5F_11125 [Thermoleophilia bacterium]